MLVARVLIEPIRRIQSIILPSKGLHPILCGLMVIGLCGAPQVLAQAPYVRLADLTTPVPGGALIPGFETFTSIAAPAIDGNTVVFVANTSPSIPEVTGIFRTAATGGPVLELVTKRTPLPEGGGVFADFGFISLDFQDGRLGFIATKKPTLGDFEIARNAYVVNGSGTGLAHVYRSAANNTTGNVAVAADRVVVHDTNLPVALQQRGSAGERTVVQSGTAVPGTTSTFLFGSIAPVEYTAYPGGVAFGAFAGALGNSIWRKNDTDADFVLLRQGGASGTPAAPFAIAAMQWLRADTEGALTFLGRSSGASPQLGIFTQRMSETLGSRREFDTIATTQMAAPSGFGNFKTFDMVATDSRVREVYDSMSMVVRARHLESDVVFAATDQTNQRAIYAFVDDQASTSGGGPRLQRVIGVGDSLDGKTITHIQMGQSAVSDRRIAFSARFSDNSEALYTVPIQGLVPSTRADATTRASVPERLLDPALRPFHNASGSTSAHATAHDIGATGATASSTAQGSIPPATAVLQGRAKAQSAGGGDAFAGLNLTQESLALGPVPGDPVNVDISFTFTGVLGFIGDGSAAMTFEARAHSMDAPPQTLFSGGLALDAAGLVRVGSYLDPSATLDVTPTVDPFGDGSSAIGYQVTTVRDFPMALTANAGERWAIEYIITVNTSTLSGAAIADFSRTLNAFALTTTEGASLAIIHAVPIPEPEQVVLMLCGLAILIVRVRCARRQL